MPSTDDDPGLVFQWDDDKASANLDKHGVSFAEASTIFRSVHTATFPDTDHSEAEDRSIAVGPSARHGLLTVVYVASGGTIRIVSARKATKREQAAHEKAQTTR